MNGATFKKGHTNSYYLCYIRSGKQQPIRGFEFLLELLGIFMQRQKFIYVSREQKQYSTVLYNILERLKDNQLWYHFKEFFETKELKILNHFVQNKFLTFSSFHNYLLVFVHSKHFIASGPPITDLQSLDMASFGSCLCIMDEKGPCRNKH